MTDQELKVAKAGLDAVIAESKALRVPPIIQAQTGQFALVQALKTDAKVDALNAEVKASAAKVEALIGRIDPLEQLLQNVLAAVEHIGTVVGKAGSKDTK